MKRKQRQQIISEYFLAIDAMRVLIREMPESSHEKIKAGLLVGQNALGKTAMGLGLSVPETAVWLQYLATSYLAAAMSVAKKLKQP